MLSRYQVSFFGSGCVMHPLFSFSEVCRIKGHIINEEIRDREVRLIDENGEQLGVVPTDRALDLAFERKLDLVNVAPNAKPAVCRIMDYGKYRYELAKREKEARKNQKVINVKEVRMTPSIDTNDLRTKARRARDFLANGDRVKVSVRFRGRELGHKENGRKVLDDFVEMIQDLGKIDKKPTMEGRSMVMFLAPLSEKDKEKLQAQEKEANEE